MADKVLVTGGAGYLGSILVPALLDHGFEVTVLDNFMYGQNTLLDCCVRSGFSVIRGDCRDRGTLARGLARADYIIPLAAVVGAPACQHDQTAARSINLDSIRLLMEMRSPQQRVIYPTTNSGYGIGEAGKFCTEETPLNPISLYGTTKVEAERIVLDAGNSLTFRLATVFGMSPRMRIDLLVNDFVHRAVTDRTVVVFEGNAKRNFVHVRDVARAFLHAIENFERMQSQPFNVGLNDANLSKLELCATIKQHVPGFVYLEAPVGEDPDKRDYIVSNEKIGKTGFQPLTSLDMGIEDLLKGYSILRRTQYANVA
jgi:nucleoside-diphosphate-sugar epimerase